MAAIATILAMEPEAILMDEPSTALDPVNRRTVINTINRLPQTKLIASHDLDMILDYHILVEADFLVNIFESGMTHEAAEKVCENIFRTKTGKQLLKDLFL